MLFREHPAFYHAGRIAGYTSVGFLLGFAGYSLDQAGVLLQIQNLSIVISGSIMVLYGLVQIFSGDGPVQSRWYHRLLAKPGVLVARLKRNRTIPQPLAVGLAGFFSALLPCGILYPVWALAAGAGSPEFGAGIGLAFVLGTIPGLIAVQILTVKMEKRIRGNTGKTIRRIAYAFFMVSGIFLLTYRGVFIQGLDFSAEATENAEHCLPGEEGNSDSPTTESKLESPIPDSSPKE